MQLPPIPQLVRSVVWLALIGLAVLVFDAVLAELRNK